LADSQPPLVCRTLNPDLTSLTTMQDFQSPHNENDLKSTPDTPDTETLEALHEKVNAMLDVPLPKEGDAWPLPVEATLEDTDDTPSKP
jgi:hypothetical protein